MHNVLLIEDNESDTFAVKRALEKYWNQDYHILCARNMLEARGLLKTQIQFDVILLDLNLPDTENERDTYQSVCSINKDVPVIILTSLLDCDLAAETLDEGIEDYVIKSEIAGHGDLLNKKIDYAIRRHRYNQNLMDEKDNEKEQLINMFAGGYSASSSS